MAMRAGGVGGLEGGSGGLGSSMALGLSMLVREFRLSGGGREGIRTDALAKCLEGIGRGPEGSEALAALGRAGEGVASWEAWSVEGIRLAAAVNRGLDEDLGSASCESVERALIVRAGNAEGLEGGPEDFKSLAALGLLRCVRGADIVDVVFADCVGRMVSGPEGTEALAALGGIGKELVSSEVIKLGSLGESGDLIGGLVQPGLKKGGGWGGSLYGWGGGSHCVASFDHSAFEILPRVSRVAEEIGAASIAAFVAA